MAKRARSTFQPGSGKRATTNIRHEVANGQQFRWDTRRADLEGPFGWSQLTVAALLKKILPALHERESATWQDLRNGGSHPVSTEQFSTLAQKRLRYAYPEFVGDTLFSLRLNGQCRIWGNRSGSLLEVFWYDPDHAVCPSDLD